MGAAAHSSYTQLIVCTIYFTLKNVAVTPSLFDVRNLIMLPMARTVCGPGPAFCVNSHGSFSSLVKPTSTNLKVVASTAPTLSAVASQKPKSAHSQFAYSIRNACCLVIPLEFNLLALFCRHSSSLIYPLLTFWISWLILSVHLLFSTYLPACTVLLPLPSDRSGLSRRARMDKPCLLIVCLWSN